MAVVTGASSGLGVHISLALAEAGADLVLVARRVDRLEQTRRRITSLGRRALSVSADVTDRDAGSHVADAAMETFGRIDILVNNAGITDHGPAHHEDSEIFTRTLDTNLGAAFRMSAACAGHMKSGSAIVNISSVLALTTVPGAPCAGYGASKAGLLGLTRHLASQWTPRKGIRVNAIVPGFFPTDLTADFPPELVGHRLLDGRWGDPDELAAAVVFLASPAASYVTGSSLAVDGGLLIS